jgi:beta-RFAP synthase
MAAESPKLRERQNTGISAVNMDTGPKLRTRRSVLASVEVAVPARLHLGFLDLDGGLGRRFGSIGLALDGIETRLVAEPAAAITADGPSSERACEFARKLTAGLGIAGGAHVTLLDAIPEHAGLGSGTQLGLAVGTAVARIYGADPGARAIAMMLGRGARSGIGIGAFEQGGVLVDGGRRLDADAEPAPIVSRMEFPEGWRILLIFDDRATGIHGEAETTAFRTLPGFSPDTAARLCRIVLMSVLPALAERDLAAFGAGVAAIQEAVGDHFAPIQGGRYASALVAECLAWLKSEGIVGLGQTSWGPTGFAFAGAEAAERLLAAARRKWAGDDRLRFMICRGRNEGGRVAPGFPAAAASDARRR